MKYVKYGLYKIPEPPIENYRTDKGGPDFIVAVVIGSLFSAVIWLGLFVLFF